MAGTGGEVTMAGAFDELSRKMTLFQEEMLGGTTLLKLFKNAVVSFADMIPGLDVSVMNKDELIAEMNEIVLEAAMLKQRLDEASETPSSRFTAVVDALDITRDERRLKLIQFRLEKINELLAEIKKEEFDDVKKPNIADVTDGGPADKEDPKLILDMQKATEKFIRTQEALQVQTGKTGGELEALRFKQQLLNTIFKDGNKLFETMTKSQKEAVDKMVEEVKKHAEATEMLRKNYDMVKGAVDKAFTVMENLIE
jgi:hypothetical protein